MYGGRKTVENTILWWINVQTCRMCQKSEEGENEGKNKEKKERENERKRERKK